MEEDSHIDENYEFNCPQFVDFAMPQSFNDRADEYFDFDHEKGEPLTFQSDDAMIPDTFESPSVKEPKEGTSTTQRDSFLQPEAQQDQEKQEISENTDVQENQAKCEVPHEAINDTPCTGNKVQTGIQEIACKTVKEVSSDMDKQNDTELIKQTDERLAIPENSQTSTTEESKVTAPQTEQGEVTQSSEKKESDIEILEPESAPQNVKLNPEQTPELDTNIEMKEAPSEVTMEDVNDNDSGETLSKDEKVVNDSGMDSKHSVNEQIVSYVEPPANEDVAVEPIDTKIDHITEVEEEKMEICEKQTEGEQMEQEPAIPEMSEHDMEEGGDAHKMPVEEKETLTKETSDQSEHLPLKKKVHSNIVTSWGDRDTTNRPQQATNKPRSNSLRRSTRSLNAKENTSFKRASSEDSTQRRSLRIKNINISSPALKKRRVSDNRSNNKEKQRKRSAGPPPSKPHIAKLTLPTTPTCMKRNAVKPGTQFKSSEEMEMERIADFRRKLAETKKQAQESYKKVQEGGSHAAKRVVIPATKPEAFSFETDQRIKQHNMSTRQDTKSFESNLRKSSHTSPSRNAHRGPTVAKPFKFAENRKRKLDEGEGKSSPYMSMASRINQFHSKTPQRYHTRRSGDNNKTISHQEVTHQKQKLTCPKTPNLESRNRKRAVTVQSAADKEEQEVQEMKSYQFKAKPVNQRIMSNTHMGLKMVTHKEPTKAIGFNLESERRMKERDQKHGKEEETDEHYEFHARPMPSKMLDGPVGLPEAKVRPMTCPKSPAFALKNRVRIKDDSIDDHEENKSHIVRANPIMHVGVPFKPQISHKRTELQPFSFEQRDKNTKARKEAKIQEIYEEEEKARQFKAKPIPESAPLPEKRVKPSTKQEPFNLAIDERSARRAEEWSKKIEEELNEQRMKATQFKAKPFEVLYHGPFVPQKPNKPLTEISEFELNTDRRAHERENFEQWKLKKELEARERKHELDRLQEEEERLEIEHMRRTELIHKAQPVKHYKPVNVHPSLRPLTQAQSPNFSDRFTK